MSIYLDQIQSQLKKVDQQFAGNKILSQFEKQTNLPRSYAVIGVVGVYLLLIFINVGGIGEILSNFVGFCVPAYYSIKALKTVDTKDDAELLTYWIVFSFLSVIEFWSKAILYWMPFYWLFKTVFLIYIAVPRFGGATLVYKALILPIADKYLPLLEMKGEEMAAKVEHAAQRAKTS